MFYSQSKQVSAPIYSNVRKKQKKLYFSSQTATNLYPCECPSGREESVPLIKKRHFLQSKGKHFFFPPLFLYLAICNWMRSILHRKKEHTRSLSWFVYSSHQGVFSNRGQKEIQQLNRLTDIEYLTNNLHNKQNKHVLPEQGTDVHLMLIQFPWPNWAN